MIGYIEGTLLKKDFEWILLLANQVGYEVLLPDIVMQSIAAKDEGDKISLFIYYHQTERQPKPVLIGFNTEVEKEFFQQFISVEAIGPLKAAKAMNIPITEIASAIENEDLARLKALKGIGARTAQKIIASLRGKITQFASPLDVDQSVTPVQDEFVNQVIDVLVGQLGYKPTDAKQMIADAFEKNNRIDSAELLLDEVFRK